MTDRKKEIAKFLSGLVVGDMFAIVWLLFEGHLPITVFGIEVTEEIARVGVGIDIVLIIGLMYYAWGSGRQAQA